MTPMWQKLYKISWVLLSVLVIIGLMMILIPDSRKIQSLQETKRQQESLNNELEQRIKELQMKQENFISNPEFVERTARKAGMVSPDEVVYQFESGNRIEPE